MTETKEKIEMRDERPGSFWRRVYIAVILNTVVVVTLLWAFSRFFS
jgi:hypothetical protein